MAVIRRVFVEKKSGFDGEARALLADLRDNLGIRALDGLRLLNRYDVCGLSAREWLRAQQAVFAEPPVDETHEESLPLSAGEIAFGVEYLPGQYDQRADSAVQCLQLLLPGCRPEVAAARVLVLRGELAASDLQRIKRYCINPVDSREAPMAKPLRLALGAARPRPCPRCAALSPVRTRNWTVWAASWGWPWTPPTCATARPISATGNSATRP